MRALASILIAASFSGAGAMSAPARFVPSTPSQAPAPAQDYRFTTGAGMLFFYVKPDKAADFEAIVSRIGEVLDKAEDPIRKQQAAHWRVLKSVEAQRDHAIYVFLFDPALAGADYDPIKILGEGLPAEVQSLYERLRDATVKVERMGLSKIR
jgi:hypothetical protein